MFPPTTCCLPAAANHRAHQARDRGLAAAAGDADDRARAEVQEEAHHRVERDTPRSRAAVRAGILERHALRYEDCGRPLSCPRGRCAEGEADRQPVQVSQTGSQSSLRYVSR